MWQRFSLYDVRVIGHYLGMLILFSTFALAVPFVVAIIYGEWEPASHYLLAMGITSVCGSALRFLRIQPGKLTRRQAMAVVGLAWIALAFFASIPLYLSGHYANWVDAMFEATSGLTTTGASVVMDLDHLSYADNMWRFTMHAIGGLGLIVVGVSLGLFGRGGGQGLFTSEGRSEHVVPNVVQSARFISNISATFIIISTIVVGLLCLNQGMAGDRAFLQAFWVSVSAFMTSGFTPMSQSIMYYHSLSIEMVLLLVILLGSLNFAIHAEIRRGNVGAFFHDTELRTTAVWLTLIVAVFAASAAGGEVLSDLPAMLRCSVFMVISAFSTTGFMVVTPTQLNSMMTSGTFFIIAILMAVGGCSGSTSGGIKVHRVTMIAKSIVVTIKETLAPDSARVVVSYNHLGRRVVSPSLVQSAMTVVSLYVVTYVIGALVGVAHGYEASQAIFDSVSMASNGGLTSTCISPGMPVTLELFYLFEMWAGRLEFLTLLALIVQIVVSIPPRRLEDWYFARKGARK